MCNNSLGNYIILWSSSTDIQEKPSLTHFENNTFSCNLGEKFEETTADGRKTHTVCNFTDGTLVQHQEWDGKESTITRKLEDGKLVVECIMNNVTCTQVYEKVE
ncbi:unnamed protein product [Nyctereutes procyonoides]|uniref:(raccoon dog) hypothetical protein n=1 Tax=Nyctereutes procyonoides TaxID=34880 RepID=A0A811Y308_NYCPR|nr:unnamed protein product [Nyctereutes procyonoides]